MCVHTGEAIVERRPLATASSEVELQKICDGVLTLMNMTLLRDGGVQEDCRVLDRNVQ